MGKKKSNTPSEEHLLLPTPPTLQPIVDTHTHIASTYSLYRAKYNKDGTNTAYPTVFDFVKGMCKERKVEGIVDVWCEPAAWSFWKELADGGEEGKWGEIGYYFVMGVHPHEARHYTDEVESQILEAMSHPRNVGWGEIGLDYHYDLSPRQIQQDVFRRQLRHAVRLGKPLTIHTREAEEDTERILKEEVPKDHKIHIHCFTDTPSFASRLLSHFPNLYIGITGVITYATNYNTANVIRTMLGLPLSLPPTDVNGEERKSVAPACCKPDEDEEGGSIPEGGKVGEQEAEIAANGTIPAGVGSSEEDVTADLEGPSGEKRLRILLETDGPYMVPANLYDSIPAIRGKKLPLCHTAMIPWTAQFISSVASHAGEGWDADKIMQIARANARDMYGV